MTNRIGRFLFGVAVGASVALVLAIAGSHQGPQHPSADPLAQQMEAGVTAAGIDLGDPEATCIAGRVRTAGGAAVAQVRAHPDLRHLRGPAGRAIAHAFEWCTGAAFVDAFGYEP